MAPGSHMSRVHVVAGTRTACVHADPVPKILGNKSRWRTTCLVETHDERDPQPHTL
jgi:hypothetical protein